MKSDSELMKEDWRLLITSFNDESFLKQVNDNAEGLNKKLGWKEYKCLCSQMSRGKNNE